MMAEYDDGARCFHVSSHNDRGQMPPGVGACELAGTRTKFDGPKIARQADEEREGSRTDRVVI